MTEEIEEIKGSDLPQIETYEELDDFYVIGHKAGESMAAQMGLIIGAKDAAEQSAEEAASYAQKVTEAEDATVAANAATANANTATTNANTATNNANTAAANAEDKTAELEAIKQLLAAQWIRPTAMEVDYPSQLTLRNKVLQAIAVSLTPDSNYTNVLYIADNNAVSVQPDGTIIVNQVGQTKVHIIPADNVQLYKTITINVIEPGMRLITSNRLRLTSGGTLRLT